MCYNNINMNIKRLLIKFTFFSLSFVKIVTSLKIIQLEMRHCTVVLFIVLLPFWYAFNIL